MASFGTFTKNVEMSMILLAESNVQKKSSQRRINEQILKVKNAILFTSILPFQIEMKYQITK